ncbi:cobyrinic acid a,c-diamide synthase [Oscillatoriales cyanobacterium LEGE 11467]|uniref:Cobyrinic acid a,c-diamide synthase n=1 Tax=Zarconia navalis LEGE 11467 TaxID=1828826 RepID=A0A928Z714_9CYAN|nr:cobyrinic acid a,c-diamide synthase [Zarconia navalis]MBE9040972.1 cobyrinic acid a,c-diamide synthase [Zarconia navalis LEGE 11467]
MRPSNPFLDNSKSAGIFDKLPKPTRQWAEKLHWNERRYILSICHILCAATSEQQAEFLDEYTADGLVSRLIEDFDTQQKVSRYLKRFYIPTKLTESLLRRYIRQFYIHCAQDVHKQPDRYLEVAVRLIGNTQESNNAFNYVMGFELLKMLFKMSWYQQEQFYILQKNQEEFIRTYIKPIRDAHRLNGIIVPKDKGKFFAKRDYYVQVPKIKTKKLIELVMATFAAQNVTNFGFAIIRHPNSIRFNYKYVFEIDSEEIFPG